VTTIYLVHSGAYEDRHVDAAFSTRALAEEFVAKNPNPAYENAGPHIEEFELDARADEQTANCYVVVTQPEPGWTEQHTYWHRDLPGELSQPGGWGRSHKSLEHARQLAGGGA
jgi:hypothetical protein